MGIALVHSSLDVPQGRGKIERLFRFVRSQLLPGFKGGTLQDINETLGCWIRDVLPPVQASGHRTGLPITLHQQDRVRQASSRRSGRLL
ncbi:hypothetical protein DFAR_2800016 [Desulfarculales bacterium]